MKVTESMLLAIDLATRSHFGQVDLQGEPYFLHVSRVMTKVQESSEFTELRLVLAILHDVIEDSGGIVGVDHIEEWFGTEIATKLNLLTRKVGQSYGDYIKALAEDSDCTVVKLADLCDNMDLSRFKNGLEESDEKRILKYKKWYNYLINVIKEKSDEI